MKIRNQALYLAMKEFVSSAITFVRDRTYREPGFNEENLGFYWVSTRQGTDFSEVPNYFECLTLLTADTVINEHLNQHVGGPPLPND